MGSNFTMSTARPKKSTLRISSISSETKDTFGAFFSLGRVSREMRYSMPSEELFNRVCLISSKSSSSDRIGIEEATKQVAAQAESLGSRTVKRAPSFVASQDRI